VQAIADVERQKVLETYRLNFLRFTEVEAMKEVEWVVEMIEEYIKKKSG
jgi:very-short-patch-repair endonuclease